MRSYAIKRRIRLGKPKWITILYLDGYAVSWKISKRHNLAISKGKAWVDGKLSGNGNTVEAEKR
mgnify:CR=1 FL=1